MFLYAISVMPSSSQAVTTAKNDKERANTFEET